MSELEKQCLSLPLHERKRLIERLMASLEIKDTKKTFEMMHRAICRTMGCEVVQRSHKRIPFIGRALLAHACYLEGMSENTIGKYIQRDHSLVNKLKKDVKTWLRMPNVFKEENEYYMKFWEEMKYETDRATIHESDSI